MNPLRSGQAVRDQWRVVNAHGLAGQRNLYDVQSQQHFPLGASNGRMRRQFSREPMFPFRIYQLPSQYRDTVDPATDWLRFCVRAAYIIANGNSVSLVTTGTDGEEFAYDETFPVASGAGVNEVLITTHSAWYWFWAVVDLGTPTTAPTAIAPTATVASGEILPPGANIVPIGYVDITDIPNRVTTIRQFVNCDLMYSCP